MIRKKDLLERIEFLEDIVGMIYDEQFKNRFINIKEKFEKFINEEIIKPAKAKKPTTKKNLAVQNKNKKVGK